MSALAAMSKEGLGEDAAVATQLLHALRARVDASIDDPNPNPTPNSNPNPNPNPNPTPTPTPTPTPNQVAQRPWDAVLVETYIARVLAQSHHPLPQAAEP